MFISLKHVMAQSSGNTHTFSMSSLSSLSRGNAKAVANAKTVERQAIIHARILAIREREATLKAIVDAKSSLCTDDRVSALKGFERMLKNAKSGRGEAGVHAEGLDEGDDEIHRFGEVAQVAQQHQREADVEQPAKRPDPKVGLEQAFKKYHFAEHAKGDATAGGRRRRGGNLQRRRGARVLVDPVGDAAHQDQRGGIEQDGEKKIHWSAKVRKFADRTPTGKNRRRSHKEDSIPAPTPIDRGAFAVSSDAARGLGQAGDLASLLGGAVGEQVVQVLAGALLRAELLADGLGQHAHGRGDLEFVVVVAQEIDDFPVLVGHLDAFGGGEVAADILVPFGEVDQVAFFVGFVGFAADFDGSHVFLLGDVRGSLEVCVYSQDWQFLCSATRSTKPP